jgi:hypothetical protein
VFIVGLFTSVTARKFKFILSTITFYCCENDLEFSRSFQCKQTNNEHSLFAPPNLYPP